MWIFTYFLTGTLFLRCFAVTVETGQNVTLVCPLEGTFPEWFGPPNRMALTNGTMVTGSGMAYVNDKDLLITNVVTSQMGEYMCQKNNSELRVDLVVNSYSYSVGFNNTQDDFIPYQPSERAIPGTVNETVTLSCTVANAYPQPQVFIHITNSSVDIVQSDITLSVTTEEDNTFTVVATTDVQVSRELDEKEVVCNATSDGYYTTATEVLRVIVPAKKLDHKAPMEHHALRRSGTYECMSIGSWPLVSIVWKVDGSATLPVGVKAFHTTCNQGLDHLFNCSSVLNVVDLTKADNGKVVTCEYIFMNNTVEEHDFTINFKFPPTKAYIHSTHPDIVQAGEEVTLTCSTDSANNFADVIEHASGVTFMWTVGSDEINVTETNRTDSPGENNGFIATQTVTFPVTRAMDGEDVTCHARNPFSQTGRYVSDTQTLNVSYSPLILMPFGTIVRVYIMDKLMLPCVASSNPAANLTWMHEDTLLMPVDTDPADNTLMYSLDQTQASDAGTYTCTADNGIAPVASKTINVIVHAKPPYPKFSPYMVKEESATVKFSTSREMPSIPRSFYVQFKLTTQDKWLEIDKEIPDTGVGEQARTVEVTLPDLLQGNTYNIRLKSVDHNGLIYYTSLDTFTTLGDELVKTEVEYRNAILVSVFVTFGVMLILLLIAVYLMRKGACGSTSKGIDLVAM